MSVAKEQFALGVHLVLKHWPALHLAVEEGLGGVKSEEKFTWLVEQVTQLFYKGKNLSWDDLELILEDVLQAEFNVELDDSSARTVARHLTTLFGQCQQGNYEDLEKLKEKLAIRPPQKIAAQQCSESESSDGEEDSEMQQDCCNVAPMDVDMNESNDSDSSVDPDGWQVVKTSKKSSGKK